MSRFAKHYRVFYVEEAILHSGPDGIALHIVHNNLFIVTPKLNNEVYQKNEEYRIQKLLTELCREESISNPILWYYTPMALPYSLMIKSSLVIYDCMDELSGFLHAPADLHSLENKLFGLAHVVFTGGRTLYESKKTKHPNVHLFPSAIDKDHFGKARQKLPDPPDQANIPPLRFGFFGVLDERFDIELIRNAAAENPTWQFILIGPIVKIDPASLPQADNIHYLGMKLYDELPQYIANWNVALIPFALNASTKYISPTKTPEYLAAGKPVISTAITDVQDPYGDLELVHIVETADEFSKAGKVALDPSDQESWLWEVDMFLRDKSWEVTWERMNSIIQDQLNYKTHSLNSIKTYV